MARNDRDPVDDMARQSGLSTSAANVPSAAERRAYMESVLGSDIDDATVRMLENMLAKDYMLANLKDEEVYEFKKLREIVLKRVYASHPHPKSMMQGELRREVYGEDSEPLRSLTSTQREKIQGAIKAAFANLTRGRDGFQQEQFSKTITESHVDKAEDDSGGWLNFS